MASNILKRNIGYNIVYRIISILLPLITAPYLSRVLGPEKMGDFSYTNSIAYYFFLLSMLGVNLYGNREIAIHRDSKEKLSNSFWQVYYIQFFLAIIMLILYFLFVRNLDNNYWLLWMVQSLYVFSAIFDINWFAFGLEKFRLTTVRSTIIRIITVICYFVFVHCETDLWKYALIVQLGNIVSLLVIWPVVKNYTSFEKPKWDQIKSHIKPDFILFLPLIASSLFQYMDKIMLGSIVNNTEVGFYTYGENILNMPIVLISAISTAILPHVSKMVADNNISDNVKMIYKSIKYLTIITLGMMFGILAISDEFVPFYLGAQYIRSAHILMILSAVIPITGIAEMIRTQYLIPRKLDKEYLIAISSGAAVNGVLNSILITTNGAEGAAIATVFAYLVLLFMECWFSRKDIDYFSIFKQLIPFLLIGSIMYVSLYLCSFVLTFNVLVNILIKIVLGIFVYLVLSCVWLKYVKHELL